MIYVSKSGRLSVQTKNIRLSGRPIFEVLFVVSYCSILQYNLSRFNMQRLSIAYWFGQSSRDHNALRS